MGFESNPNRTHRTRTLFWAKRTEPNEPNVNSWPIPTEPSGYSNRTLWQGFDSIPMAVKNSQIWIMSHPFIKLIMVFSVCVLLKHFNCERPPDCRTKCKIHVYCKAILCGWNTQTEPNRTRTTVSIESNSTEPRQNSNRTEPNPNLDRTELLSVRSLPITSPNPTECICP